MSAKQVHDVHLANIDKTSALLNSSGTDPLAKNATINLTYLKLTVSDPAFIWLGAAAIGSAKVGENILYI